MTAHEKVFINVLAKAAHPRYFLEKALLEGTDGLDYVSLISSQTSDVNIRKIYEKVFINDIEI